MTDAKLDEPTVEYKFSWAWQVYSLLGQSSITLSDVTATATELNVLDGITATTAELNILDGVTSTTAELNKLDGATVTTTELNKLSGVTENLVTSPTSSPKIAAGEYTMDATDDTNGFSTIATGLTTIATAIVQVVDSGDNVVISDADITWSGANITVADGSTFACTPGYKARWFAFGS